MTSRGSSEREVNGRAALAEEELRKLFHDLNNNFAVIELWVTVLLESSCPQCRAGSDEVAEAIRRNLIAAQASTRKLRASGPFSGFLR
jgi:hypothetical protein